MNLFFELLQVALGTREAMGALPGSREEWEELFKNAGKHNLLGITFPVIDRLHDETEIPLSVYSRWALMKERVQQKNARLNAECGKLYRQLAADGLKSCVLKGQSLAVLYPRPELRQCGDIDIWIEGGFWTVYNYFNARYEITNVFYHQCDVKLDKGVNLEPHYTPSWMNSPCADRRLQKYFARKAPEQFANFDERLGFAVPTLRFNAVYLLIHIYRHVLDEGIGLRQLLDYYYLLKALSPEDRTFALGELRELHLGSFAAGVMHVLKTVFLASDEILLCPPDERQGEFLVEEIMISGNFGRYDERNRHSKHESRLMHAKRKLTRSLRYLEYYPGEVLGIPLFMVRHYFWRRRRGVLKKV